MENATDDVDEDKWQADFEKDLAALINQYNVEIGSETPDYVLAKYLMLCLHAWEEGIQLRDYWYRRLPPWDEEA